MSKAEDFLNNHKDGFNSYEKNDIVGMSKIRLQALLSDFHDQQLKSKLEGVSEEDIYEESENYSDEIAAGFIKGTDFILTKLKSK